MKGKALVQLINVVIVKPISQSMFQEVGGEGVVLCKGESVTC